MEQYCYVKEAGTASIKKDKGKAKYQDIEKL
jgi:hypothetical protein